MKNSALTLKSIRHAPIMDNYAYLTALWRTCSPAVCSLNSQKVQPKRSKRIGETLKRVPRAIYECRLPGLAWSGLVM